MTRTGERGSGGVGTKLERCLVDFLLEVVEQAVDGLFVMADDTAGSNTVDDRGNVTAQALELALEDLA